LKLLLDEMYSPQIAVQLRRRGHDVVHASELGLAGRPDSEIFALIAGQGRAIVTNNTEDYVKLFNQAAAAGQDHGGVLLTSDRPMPRSRSTIGLFVRVLAKLLDRHPGDKEFRNELRWLP